MRFLLFIIRENEKKKKRKDEFSFPLFDSITNKKKKTPYLYTVATKFDYGKIEQVPYDQDDSFIR